MCLYYVLCPSTQMNVYFVKSFTFHVCWKVEIRIEQNLIHIDVYKYVFFIFSIHKFTNNFIL